MNALKILALFLFLIVSVYPQPDRLPVIDMHLHCFNSESFFTGPDLNGVAASKNADENFSLAYGLMKKYNIVKGFISGNYNSVEDWISKDTDKRFIRGFEVESAEGLDTITFENLIREGKIEIFGEIGAVYKGLTLSDPGFEPYLRICEKYDIPVALHTGGGPPGISYIEGYSACRIALGDPFLIEDVLVKFPKLRIYLMHSGEVFY
jgi:hypothetical protein